VIGKMVSNPSGGADINVTSIMDLNDTNTKIYEAHYAVSRDWAETIEALHGADFVLSYDRMTDEVQCTVAEFLLDDNAPGKKEACKGEFHNTFHFALNNTVSMDNRIPPYGTQYDVAVRRNTLPVPASQYGGGQIGSIYNYWDEVPLNPPANADHAQIELLYQGTSWEYIQFLYLANTGENAFLGQEGLNMLDAWLNAPGATDPLSRTMVPPVVMASINWSGEVPGCSGVDVVIQNRVFDGNISCVAESSLTANTAVLIKTGAEVTFQSPQVALGPGFSVESGAVFRVLTGL